MKELIGILEGQFPHWRFMSTFIKRPNYHTTICCLEKPRCSVSLTSPISLHKGFTLHVYDAADSYTGLYLRAIKQNAPYIFRLLIIEYARQEVEDPKDKRYLLRSLRNNG